MMDALFRAFAEFLSFCHEQMLFPEKTVREKRHCVALAFGNTLPHLSHSLKSTIKT